MDESFMFVSSEQTFLLCQVDDKLVQMNISEENEKICLLMNCTSPNGRTHTPPDPLPIFCLFLLDFFQTHRRQEKSLRCTLCVLGDPW